MAFVTGLVNQELLLRNEYLAAEDDLALNRKPPAYSAGKQPLTKQCGFSAWARFDLFTFARLYRINQRRTTSR